MYTTGLLRHMLLWQKFALVGIVLLVAVTIPTWLYLQEADKTWDAIALEREGLKPMGMVLRTIQLTQQHRGLSAIVLGGVKTEKEKRTAKQRDADAAYAAMDTLVTSINDDAVTNAWQSAKQDWGRIREAVSTMSFTVGQSYQAHTELMTKLLLLNDLVGDYFGLSLDPDVDTHQLIQAMFYVQPYVMEELGKTRARGAGFLAKGEASLEDKLFMTGLTARVGDRITQMRSAFNKATAKAPALETELGSGMANAHALALKAIDLTSEKIVIADALTYPSVDYFNLLTHALDAQFAWNTAASLVVERKINKKIADLRTTRWMLAGVLTLLLIIAVLLLKSIARSIKMPITDAIQVARNIASGNLTSHFGPTAKDEVGQLLAALRDMNCNLVNMISNMRRSIEEINTGANEIAVGNNDLSARTESQASSLEETAASMVQMTATVRQNAEIASQANLLGNGAAAVATHGGSVVGQVISTMSAINDSSRKIVDIIAVIDGIAFQTNILSLNAAVEAARAGEQGRGFAVVATEVRNLAQRSAQAAREIKSLIGSSVEKVEAGNELVSKAGQAMDEIVTSIGRVTTMMGEIVTATAEQRNGIEQIDQAIALMDNMTQKNAALVEEAAAAASAMKDQSQRLVQAVDSFSLN